MPAMPASLNEDEDLSINCLHLIPLASQVEALVAKDKFEDADKAKVTCAINNCLKVR